MDANTRARSLASIRNLPTAATGTSLLSLYNFAKASGGTSANYPATMAVFVSGSLEDNPAIHLVNVTHDQYGPILKFENNLDAFAAPAAGTARDDHGLCTITFDGDHYNATSGMFGKIDVDQVAVGNSWSPTSGSGKMKFTVRCSGSEVSLFELLGGNYNPPGGQRPEATFNPSGQDFSFIVNTDQRSDAFKVYQGGVGIGSAVNFIVNGDTDIS